MKPAALDAVDRLIKALTWGYSQEADEYYVKDLIPRMIEDPDNPILELTESEKTIAHELRDLLTDDEALRLPELVELRRSRQLEELAYDRDRRLESEAEQKREQERIERTRRTEQERLRREEEARRLELKARQARFGARLQWAKIRREKREAFELELINCFQRDFLSADKFYDSHPDRNLLSREELGRLKGEFVRAWLRRNAAIELDDEQAAATATTGGDRLIVARAGSGKTRTLVARACFLLGHCKVLPSEVILLAFNKKAAGEMESRIREILGSTSPHTMTFHALAYAVVRPGETLLYDDATSGEMWLSDRIQAIVDDLMEHPVHALTIRELMLAYFRDDWEQVVDGKFHLTLQEFLEHRRALPRQTLNGEYVKSFGEKAIANTLFEHAIDYKYESNFRWDDVNYRPDFKIPAPSGGKGGVIIEYFGLKGDPDYDARSAEKRRFWAQKPEWTFLEYTPSDILRDGPSGFSKSLLGDLQALGISFRKLSEDDIWDRISTLRAIAGFSKAMVTFISRGRKLGASFAQLKQRVAEHSPCSRTEHLFLELGMNVYRKHMNSLAESKEDDFDGLMWRCSQMVKAGESSFVREKGRERGDLSKIRFILIDEFQDFSQPFYELVQAIRSISPQVEFFCVGDDWQAINSFAGSDLRYFKQFHRIFQRPGTKHVATNYRSSQKIVAVGNALMKRMGVPAKANDGQLGWVCVCKMDDFRPSPTEEFEHESDEITPALLRLLRRFLDQGKDVAILSRRNGIPWYANLQRQTSSSENDNKRFLEHVKKYLPTDDHERISISTTHKYKGREKDAIVIVDAVDRSYPLIHPHWVFLRVFGENLSAIIDEERRLFYVALTRPFTTLAILTDSLASSPFLKDIQSEVSIEELNWGRLTPVPTPGKAVLEIRVSNAYSVKDQLKAAGYRWNNGLKYWYRVLPAEAFSMEDLLSNPWSNSTVRIEIVSETGECQYAWNTDVLGA